MVLQGREFAMADPLQCSQQKQNCEVETAQLKITSVREYRELDAKHRESAKEADANSRRVRVRVVCLPVSTQFLVVPIRWSISPASWKAARRSAQCCKINWSDLRSSRCGRDWPESSSEKR